MYQNKVTLIGFLGSDAEVRSNDNRSFTTLSLATTSSYKKDGKYISHTEWHRCVVFGKLSEFAGTLKKGAHIQVEGELRSREYDSKKTDSKQRIWEIKVDSILKLDRAETSAPEDGEQDDARYGKPAPYPLEARRHQQDADEAERDEKIGRQREKTEDFREDEEHYLFFHAS